MKQNKYQKFAAQVVATVLAAIVAALMGDNAITTAEWLNVIVLGLGAVAVLGAATFSTGVWAYTKLYVSAASVAAAFLVSAITDGITSTEWVQLALAVLGALGVFALPGPVTQPATPRNTAV